MNITLRECLVVKAEVNKEYEEAVQEYREILTGMTKSEVAIKYWEKEVAEGRATKEEKLTLGKTELIVTSSYEPIPMEWNEYVTEMNKIAEYEGRFWQTYNRIRYLNTWIVPSCEEVETEIEDIKAQLTGLKGGLFLTQEDQNILLSMMKSLAITVLI